MPKPRILPNVILGLLDNHPQMSGRDIENEFQTEIGEFWQASHSQIYPELKRMLADGWIQMVDAQPGDDGKVIRYDITSAGRTHLLDWLHEPVNSDNDALSSLKLYFIHNRTSPTLTSILTAEIRLHRAHVAHLQEREQQLFGSSSLIEQQYGHYLILKRAIEREQNNVVWLEQTLKELKP
ncbi:MAG TPA: PadR family transcriptional regulator [Lactobacillus sp.]|nr:PadR family transcriptional regulator [Lactobacillus sp.]